VPRHCRGNWPDRYQGQPRRRHQGTSGGLSLAGTIISSLDLVSTHTCDQINAVIGVCIDEGPDSNHSPQITLEVWEQDELANAVCTSSQIWLYPGPGQADSSNISLSLPFNAFFANASPRRPFEHLASDCVVDRDDLKNWLKLISRKWRAYESRNLPVDIECY
jgi:hypothetical protein